MSGLFFIVDLLDMGRKKNIYFLIYGFKPPPSQNEVKHSHSILIQKTLKLAKNPKAIKKIELKFISLQSNKNK